MPGKDKKHYTSDGDSYSGPPHKMGKKLMSGATNTADSKVLSHRPRKGKTMMNRKAK